MTSSSSARVQKALYRSLLRLGRDLDRNPLGKALLVAQPDRFFNRRLQQVVQLPQISGVEGNVTSLLEKFNQGEHYTPTSSAQQAVRQHAPAYDIDTGLALLRVLSMASAGGAALSQHVHDAAASAALTKPLTNLESTDAIVPGSLLLTHPVACLGQVSERVDAAPDLIVTLRSSAMTEWCGD